MRVFLEILGAHYLFLPEDFEHLCAAHGTEACHSPPLTALAGHRDFLGILHLALLAALHAVSFIHIFIPV